ncbi:MAG: zinc metalloprotease HtpX [Alphaproteobacteria bacterium]|nr:zinc metalloprotease HtpX [Alphaproteobacteria bacterium]
MKTTYLKTTILLAGMTALFGAAGFALGGQSGMVIALVFAAGMNLFAYWNSDKMILRQFKAQPVAEGAFYSMVARLAANAGLPMPRVYILPNKQPNAFATGRNPENAAVAATTSLLEMLNEDEIEGVMAHELAHVKNRDTLIMTITASIAGALSMLANFGMMFGGGTHNGQRAVPPVVAILLMIIAPLAAMIVQMMISRTREYEADRIGAEICGKPRALASALEKISGKTKIIDNIEAEENPAMAHMFIINPLHMQAIDSLFSTHPKTEERIRRLLAMQTIAPENNNPWS